MRILFQQDVLLVMNSCILSPPGGNVNFTDHAKLSLYWIIKSDVFSLCPWFRGYFCQQSNAIIIQSSQSYNPMSVTTPARSQHSFCCIALLLTLMLFPIQPFLSVLQNPCPAVITTWLPHPLTHLRPISPNQLPLVGLCRPISTRTLPDCLVSIHPILQPWLSDSVFLNHCLFFRLMIYSLPSTWLRLSFRLIYWLWPLPVSVLKLTKSLHYYDCLCVVLLGSGLFCATSVTLSPPGKCDVYCKHQAIMQMICSPFHI